MWRGGRGLRIWEKGNVEGEERLERGEGEGNFNQGII